MAVQNQIELLLALERGDFAAILGTNESVEIDMKDSPYLLESPRQKWELAKDVAALANARGGVIVVGFRTERPAHVLVDTVTEHRPVNKTLVNWDSYAGTIAQWIHPPPRGITSRWFPSDAGQERGVFTISIPPQDEAAKHFVVREINREDGSFPGAIGVPIRDGDRVVWLRPEGVQALLREALWLRQHGMVGQTTTEADRLGADEHRVRQRCEAIQQLANWVQMPFLALHALPALALPRPDDFYSDDGVKGRLVNHPVLREAGFHLQTRRDVDVVQDGSLVSVSHRRAVWLAPNGFFSAAAVADADFLGWYFNDDADPGPLTINPRVLAEYVLEFCRFVHTQLAPRTDEPPALWMSTIGFDRRRGVVLVPEIGAGGAMVRFWRAMGFQPRPPRQSEAHVRLASRGNAGEDAYQLLVEFYALFGAPPTLIPFQQNGRIDEQVLTGEMSQ